MGKHEASKPLLGCRILVVEDNLLFGEMITDILVEAGASIVGPYDSMVEALENLSKLSAIDGALLDIDLGDVRSFPLAEALQKTKIPFMFLTGMKRADLPPQFGRTPHMLKPFDEDELVARLVEIGVTCN